MKVVLFIVLFFLSFGLLYLGEKSKEGSISKRVLISIVSSVLLTFVSSISYDYIKNIWFAESVEAGVLRGAYPYFVLTNEEYGNFCIELEQIENRGVDGFEISIRYVNSEYEKVIVWSYTEPVWINIEPIEYEITIMSPDRTYVETYPCTVEDEGKTHLTLPVYDD